MILLDAVYINNSGGKILLEYFIKSLKERDLLSIFFFLFDDRLESPVLNDIDIKQQRKISASENRRKHFYKHHVANFSTIFCFANVPPPIPVKKNKTFILFHNSLILGNKNTAYSLTQRVKFFIKKLYISLKNDTRYNWIVQTKNMKASLSKSLNINLNTIIVCPFYAQDRFKNLNKRLQKNKNNFLYIADGVAQKNHKILLEAWDIINVQKLLPFTLHLTIPNSFPSLLAEINYLQNKGVKIVNHGYCDFKQLAILYETCNCFLMPSLTESFGLPIIEAVEAGCEIIASDLVYVHDIISPFATFDPDSAIDVSKKVICFFEEKSNSKKSELKVQNEINYLINLITNNV